MDRYLADPEAREYSGSLRVRMPKHLHRDLARQAEQDGVSLNTLIVALLERGMGAVDRGSATVPASAPMAPTQG
jgi:predicted HicB family RNase H-like nuclease